MNKIITISREFGSGGREIGKRLADRLGLAYYDREIITEVAKKTEMAEQYIQNINENGVSPYPFQFAKSFATYSNFQKHQTEILIVEQDVIKHIAQKGNCVIVGRGANSILKGYNPMNIFVYADMESKLNRCRNRMSENENFTDKELKNKIIQVDKSRKNYHNIISSLEWGDKRNYNLCINTSGIEIKTVIPSLANYIETWFGGNNK